MAELGYCGDGSYAFNNNGGSPAAAVWIGGEKFVEVPVSEKGVVMKSKLVDRITGAMPLGLDHVAAEGVAEGLVVRFGGHPTVASRVYEAVVKPDQMGREIGMRLFALHAEQRELYAPTAALD